MEARCPNIPFLDRALFYYSVLNVSCRQLAQKNNSRDSQPLNELGL